jgi:hypothetical protein
MRNGLLHATLVLAFSAASAIAQQPSPYMVPGAEASQTYNEPLPLAPTYGPQGGPPQGPASPNGPPPLPDNLPGAFDPPPPPEPPVAMFAVDYLHWWMHKPLPPLVTSSQSGASAILGNPGTIVLFGGEHPEDEEHSGVRLSFVKWFGCSGIGLEGRAEFLGDSGNHFQAGSDSNGLPPLGRPVIDTQTGAETAENISLPGAFVGGITVVSQTLMWDGQINLLCQLSQDCAYPNIFFGVRYLDLDEKLTITQDSTGLLQGLIGNSGQFFNDTNAHIVDFFRTRNQFWGGQIGAQNQWDWKHWFFRARGSIGVGYTHEEADVYGQTTLNFPNITSATFNGGVLATGNNTGHFVHNEITVMPEGELTLGWHICSWLDFSVGYNFLYWSEVTRPKDIINREVNPVQLPTSVQGTTFNPVHTLAFHDSDFWAQGINLGLAIHY